MPLALIVEKIDTVPEALRGEYTEKDGKFHLNVEGLEEHPSTAALRAAIKKERDDNKPIKEAIAAWKKIGKTPDEIAELVAAKETAEAELAKKAGNFDGVLKQHQTKWDGEKQTLVSERDTALNVARSATVDSGIKTALVTSKATGEGVALLPKILGERVKTEFVGGKFVTTIMQADGETPMIGNGTGGNANYDDLVKEAVKNFPSLFEGAGSGGGTPPKGGGGSGAKTMSTTEFNALSPKERAAKMADGVTLKD